jgi:rhodanese-related sulfurtransferase
VDLYRYDEAWELNPTTALSNLYSSTTAPISCLSEWLLIDLRNATDFSVGHFRDYLNWPLQSLTPGAKSPFYDSQALEAQWLELELFGTNNTTSESCLKEVESPGRPIMLVCYDGDAARVATSVLRARNIQALSMKGGMLGYEFGHLITSSANEREQKQQEKMQHIGTGDVSISEVAITEKAAMNRRGPLTTTV